MPNPFLSDEWMIEARAIRERYSGQTPPITTSIKINLVVNDAPFAEGAVHGYLDTSSGELVMEQGNLEGADCTMTTDYTTAKAIFVDQDPTVGMQAFMTGKITIQGDMMKVMAMQTAIPSNDVTNQIADEIKAITA